MREVGKRKRARERAFGYNEEGIKFAKHQNCHLTPEYLFEKSPLSCDNLG